MRIGSRSFEPRPFTTLVAIVVFAGLILLGVWQLHRAKERQALFDAFAAGTEAPLAIGGASPPVPRYRRVQATGRYDSAHQVLIDNMVSHERAGYYVLTPLALAGGGWVWVNRGWVPTGSSRDRLPDITVGEGERPVTGRADRLPAPGIRLGHEAVLSPPFPVVASFPSATELARLLSEPSWTAATETILLDAREPDGYVREWSAPGFPPMRNIGYAVQWFGLALALAVIYAVTNTRKSGADPKRDGAAQ
jgi:surfeit locus 1 family protein